MSLRNLCVLGILCGGALSAHAHHGVAGVGAAALEGPGAPVESGSSAVLPEGKTLLYAKLDHAKFKTYDSAAVESDYSQFWMVGLGHGFTPWFSAYVFAPYNIKKDEPGGFKSKGWADISAMGQVGFKYDDGLKLVTANESLDDMEDWHFTVFGGGTLPTGKANHRLSGGSIDPGMSLGFGKPSYSLGLTATKQLSRDLTFNMEASIIRFQEYQYDDGNKVKFAHESGQPLPRRRRARSAIPGTWPRHREWCWRGSHRRQGDLPAARTALLQRQHELRGGHQEAGLDAPQRKQPATGRRR